MQNTINNLTIRFLTLAIIILNICCNNNNKEPKDYKYEDSLKTLNPGLQPGSGYTLSEPVKYSSGGMASKFSVLYKDGNPIDTIDYYFGINLIGKDSLIVFIIKDFDYSREDGISANQYQYTLITNNEKVILSKILPHFSNDFSSPAVIDNFLYYWGIHNIENEDDTRLFAVKYNFKSGKLDSLFLDNYIEEGTDNWNNYYQPHKENNDIVYQYRGGKWLINASDFSLVATAVFVINNSSVTITFTKDFYFNIYELQDFFSKYSKSLNYHEVHSDDLTGDGLIDSLVNDVFIYNGNNCVVKSEIFSKGKIVYSDSVLFSREDGKYIWGEDSNYNKLYPCSFLYSCYKLKVKYYSLLKEDIDYRIFMYLYSKEEEFKKQRLSKAVIEKKLNDIKKYVNNYKGKFISNISSDDTETYIFDKELNKFVEFYSP